MKRYRTVGTRVARLLQLCGDKVYDDHDHADDHLDSTPMLSVSSCALPPVWRLSSHPLAPTSLTLSPPFHNSMTGALVSHSQIYKTLDALRKELLKMTKAAGEAGGHQRPAAFPVGVVVCGGAVRELLLTGEIQPSFVEECEGGSAIQAAGNEGEAGRCFVVVVVVVVSSSLSSSSLLSSRGRGGGGGGGGCGGCGGVVRWRTVVLVVRR
jgi:hypothetical protein